MRFTIEIVRDLDFDSHISKGIEENFSPFCFFVKMKLLLQKNLYYENKTIFTNFDAVSVFRFFSK